MLFFLIKTLLIMGFILNTSSMLNCRALTQIGTPKRFYRADNRSGRHSLSSIQLVNTFDIITRSKQRNCAFWQEWIKFVQVFTKTLRKSRCMDNSNLLNDLDNNKENQGFNTFDILSMFLCFSLVVSIGVVLFNNHLQQNKSAVAQNYVENLAQKLIMKPVISSMDSNGRLPASESNLDIDPWGAAYKYSVVKNSYGQPIYIVVLSGGPNHTFETEVSDTLAFSQSLIENVQIKGDDIGYVKSFR